MSWLLGIDTASTQLDIGLLTDGDAACSYRRFMPGSHAEHISAAMKDILQAGGIEAQDISRVGAVVGPGSFTGLRIGIAFLKGFFLARDARILPVSSLHALAHSWDTDNATIAVALEARRGNVFAARFKKHNGITSRLSDDTRISVEQFGDEIRDDDTVLIDTLGFAKSTLCEQLSGIAKLYLIEKQHISRGLAAADIAWQSISDEGAWKSPIELLPRYMQESAAEIRQKRTRAVQ